VLEEELDSIISEEREGPKSGPSIGPIIIRSQGTDRERAEATMMKMMTIEGLLNHPARSAAFSRRTPEPDTHSITLLIQASSWLRLVSRAALHGAHMPEPPFVRAPHCSERAGPS
jgi:hypothetical protein